MLRRLYWDRTTTLFTEDEVRDRLFKTRASDLIQFTGHCKISEKGLGDLEMAAANSCAWWISGS
jgi:hypothetical protein